MDRFHARAPARDAFATDARSPDARYRGARSACRPSAHLARVLAWLLLLPVCTGHADPAIEVGRTFPRAAENHEAWVHVRYRYDDAGHAEDVVLEDSSGLRDSILHVRRALEDAAPRPQASGRSEDLLVLFDSRRRMLFDGETKRRLRRWRDMLERGDMVRAEAARAAARAVRLPGIDGAARFALLDAVHERALENPEREASALRRVLVLGGERLEDADLEHSARRLVALESGLGRLGLARHSCRRHARWLDAELCEQVEAELEHVRSEQLVIEVDGRLVFAPVTSETRIVEVTNDRSNFDWTGATQHRALGNRAPAVWVGREAPEARSEGRFVYRPVHRFVVLEATEGRLERLEIACENGFSAVRPEAGRGWRLPDDWGTCALRFFGEPATHVVLLDLPPDA